MSKKYSIEFSRGVNFIGRNGYFMSSGIQMIKSARRGGDNIELYPITSKGNIGNCLMEIPLEDLDTVIHHLTELKKTIV